MLKFFKNLALVYATCLFLVGCANSSPLKKSIALQKTEPHLLETTKHMHICAGDRYKKEAQTLQNLVIKIQKSLSANKKQKTAFLIAEDLWEKFQKAECDFQITKKSGTSMAPVLYLNCLDQQTKRRITDLKGYLRCPEGDISCPLF